MRRPPTTALDATIVTGDVTDAGVVTRIREALGDQPLRLLVNNAGVDGGSHRPEELDVDIVERMLEVNAIGAARVLHAALPALYRAEQATVVNVSSRLGSLAHASAGRYAHLHQSIAYRMSKAALNMLTLTAAEGLGDAPIAVCSVHPGRLRTEMAAPDADLDADVAARRLLDWLESGERVGGRFYSLDTESDLPW